MKTTPYLDYSDPNYKRLKYVRYADDFIVGIRGSYTDAIIIKNKIKDFCATIGLTLSETKTKITNLLKEKAKFLGVYIGRSTHQSYRTSTNNTTQRTNQQLRLTVSLDDIRKKLKTNNFLTSTTDGIKSHPKFIWLPQTHKQILVLYNSVYRGITNYYRFTHNYPKLVSYLHVTLKASCAKLLARKFNL